MQDIQQQPMMSSGSSSSSKNSKGMLYGLIVCAVLAVGGIGFGIFGMTQKSSHPADMKVEIKNEDGTTTTLETEKIEVSNDDGQTVATITDTAVRNKNPVIRGDYSMDFMSPNIGKRVNITVQDGAITSCWLSVDEDYSSRRKVSDCTVSGITGNIFKVAFVGRGNGLGSEAIVAFLMEDGTIKYFPLSDVADGKNSFTVKDLSVGGFVTDVIEVHIPHAGSTMFVLSDGSLKEYNESMM